MSARYFMLRFLGFSLVLVGCAGAPPKAPIAPSPSASVQTSAHLPEAKSERVRTRSLALPLELRLPTKSEWRTTDGPLWLEAEHAPSASKLALRTWRTERIVRRSECESDARLARPSIPTIHEEAIVDRRAFAAPAGFESELVVGVEPTPLGVQGYALVFGSSIGFCYAALFTTTASGGDAEREVATRLGVAVDEILSSVRARSVDDRAPRRRLVSTPKSAPATPGN